MTTSRIVRTVKVVIYVGDDGRLTVGVIGSEHVGGRRVDHRHFGPAPIAPRLGDAPRGIPAPIWVAYLALEQAITRLERAEVTDEP